MACNAADGTSCRMSGTAEMRVAFTDACASYRRTFPSGPEHEFVRLLREACIGEADLPPPPRRPATLPFAKPAYDVPDVAELSTVVPLASLLRLMSQSDKARFERDHSVRFTVTGSTAGSQAKIESESKLVDRLERAPRAAKWFRMAPDETHGRPYVWFTAREDLEAAFSARKDWGVSRAEIARDVLGLIHHGPQARGSDGPNRLIALHFPSTVAARAGHFRPAAVQAFDNRRFMLSYGKDDHVGDAGWGRAFDLNLFASTNRPPIGARERVLVRLQENLFADDEVIHFDYLGEISDLRGTIPKRDDDPSFLEYIRRGRDADDLVVEMCR